MIDAEMTRSSDADDDDKLLLSLTEDFMGPNARADNKDDELSAKSSDDVDQVLPAILQEPQKQTLSAK